MKTGCMKRSAQGLALILVDLLWAGLAARGFNALPPVELADLYHAQVLSPVTVTNDLAIKLSGKPWQFSAGDKCNFTFFSKSVRDVAVGRDGLRFTAAGDETIIGWGNYDNVQPPAQRLRMFPGFNDVELVVRQSATASVWRFTLWMDGVEKIEGNMGGARAFELGAVSLSLVNQSSIFEAQVTGTNRQTVRFRAFRGRPDGFGLRIAGPAGNQIVIEQVRVFQVNRSACFRHTFNLPPGRAVWRAVGEVGGGRLWLNGREVTFRPELLRNKSATRTFPVDLAPNLKPGAANIIAMDATDTLAYFQGRVVLDDGSEILLDSGPAWKTALQAAAGWTDPGFDDSAWQPASLAALPAILDRRWPVYDGGILLENPGADPKLYYDERAPVRVQVRVPRGLAAEPVAAHWVLRRVERENERPEAGRGVVAQWTPQPQTASQVCTVDVGVRAPGVYTLAVELRAGDRVRARRIEEILMVIDRLPMKAVAGNSYEEGLELELEDVIDFTDLQDPHQWTEVTAPANTGAGPAGQRVTAPRIVHTNGLAYREVTDGGKAAMFGYRFEFRQPYGWYLLVLEYPNDAERWIGAALVGAVRWFNETPLIPWRGSGDAQCSPAVVTGGKFPLDGKLHELRWLCWARPEIQTLEVVNVMSDLRAAAARLRIYRVKELPALQVAASGERFFGIHTERALQTANAFGDSSGLDYYQNVYNRLGYDMVAKYTQRQRWYFEACRNYTAYLRFTGQNAHAMGAYQYHEMNTCYEPPEGVPGDGHLLCDISETALRFFDRNQIAMYSVVEYIEHKAMRPHFPASDEEIAAGADTIQFVSREGKKGGLSVNPNHPAVQMGYLRVAEELAQKFAFSPAWKGIFYNVAPGEFGPTTPPSGDTPLEYDYSDATLARFERELQTKLPIDPRDPKRFEKRYLLLTSDALRETWLDWRCRNMGSYLTLTRDRLRRYRPDLNVLCNWHICGRPIRSWLKDPDGIAYDEFARRLGMQPAVVRDEPGIWFGRTIYPIGSSHGQEGGSQVWAHNVDPGVIAYYDLPNRMVVLNTCWYEYRTRPNDPQWPTGVKPKTLGLVAEAHDDFVWESYTQAMIGADPDILLYGFIDCPMITSREQHVREVAKVITALPKEKFEPVQGTADFKHNLAIRALSKGSAFWFYVANPGYWPIQGRVVLSGKTAVVTPCDNRPVATREENGKTVVPIALKPYGLIAFKASDQLSVNRNQSEKDKSKIQSPAQSGTSPKLAPLSAGSKIEIESWTNLPLAETDLAHMRGILRAVTAIMAQPEAALVVKLEDRNFLRAVMARAEKHLSAGEYAAAWSELTHWRFWELWQLMIKAQRFSARLPDRPNQPVADDRDTWERPALKVAAVRGAPPVVDARLDDAAWQEAPATFRFFSIATGNLYHGVPLMDTAVQACYDQERLYLGLRMADRDVKALRKTASRENPIEVLRQYDDTLVMFLNVSSNQIGQFAVNAGNIKYYATSGAWNVDTNNFCRAPWDAAVGVAEGWWIIEAAIPFATLGMPAPQASDMVSANFVRRFRNFMLPESYWARVRRSWSDTDCYGNLVFQ